MAEFITIIFLSVPLIGSAPNKLKDESSEFDVSHVSKPKEHSIEN